MGHGRIVCTNNLTDIEISKKTAEKMKNLLSICVDFSVCGELIHLGELSSLLPPFTIDFDPSFVDVENFVTVHPIPIPIERAKV